MGARKTRLARLAPVERWTTRSPFRQSLPICCVLPSQENRYSRPLVSHGRSGTGLLLPGRFVSIESDNRHSSGRTVATLPRPHLGCYGVRVLLSPCLGRALVSSALHTRGASLVCRSCRPPDFNNKRQSCLVSWGKCPTSHVAKILVVSQLGNMIYCRNADKEIGVFC